VDFIREVPNLSLSVYYESIKRELNKRLIFDSRCDARQSLEIQRREKVKRGEKKLFLFFFIACSSS
jgi:hypothetical protein